MDESGLQGSIIKRLRKKLMASDSQFDMVQALYGGGYLFKET
jgi:DNA-binding response OmpR family regulator